MKMGVSYLSRGDLPNAMSELSMAEQLSPNDPTIQSNLGLVYQLRGRPAEAEKRFKRALTLDPKFSDVRTNLARLYIDQDRIPEAIKELKIVENDLTYPAPTKVLTLYGMAEFKLNHFAAAEEKLSQALKIERENCLAANFLGRSYYAQRKMSAAAQVLDQAVKYCKGAKFEDPLFYSAMAHYSAGHKEESRARIEELLEQYPNGNFATKGRAMLKILE